MAPLFFDRKALACVFTLKFLNDNSNDEQFQLPPQAEAGEDGPIRLTGGCPSDIEEEEEGEYGGGGNVARMPSAEELRRRQEEERNEHAARQFQAQYDAEAQRGGDGQVEEDEQIAFFVEAQLLEEEEEEEEEDDGASEAEAEGEGGYVQPGFQNLETMEVEENKKGPWVASPASKPDPNEGPRPSSMERARQALKNGANYLNCFSTDKRGPPSDRQESREARRVSGAKAHKQQRHLGCRSNSAVVDTTPFVPQGQIDDLYALLCVKHRDWVEVMSQSSTKQSPKDHREGTIPNAFNGDDLADVLIHILMNFPSSSVKSKEKILSGGIAYTNDEGIPDQVSWRSIIVPLIKIMEKYYGATRDDAIEKVRKHVAFGNRVPIMAPANWNKDSNMRKDYKKCIAITDDPMRRIYEDVIKSFPNLAAAPVFGKPPFEFVNNGAFQEPLFGDKLIQNSSLPHGSQLNNGYGITKEQRDNTLVVLNKIAAILMEVEATPLPEDELDEILPYFTKNLGGGITQNSRGEYITSLVDGINGLSLEQIEEMGDIDDSFLDGRSRWAIKKSVKKVIEQGQEATIHTYICTGCGQCLSTVLHTDATDISVLYTCQVAAAVMTFADPLTEMTSHGAPLIQWFFE